MVKLSGIGQFTNRFFRSLPNENRNRDNPALVLWYGVCSMTAARVILALLSSVGAAVCGFVLLVSGAPGDALWVFVVGQGIGAALMPDI